MKRHIYLIGFMGTGKSTISRRLKARLHVKDVEMDAQIAQENGMSINEIFERFGEQYFRDLETELLRKTAELTPRIVSCGGGVVLREENVRIMKKSGIIVLLTATPETVFSRVCHSSSRPILNGNMNVEYIASLMEKRRAAYEAACDISVVTDGKSPEQIMREILKFYNK